MHRIALRNSARKVALAAAPRVRSPVFFSFVCVSKLFNRTAHSRRAHMQLPSLVRTLLSQYYNALTCAFVVPVFSFDLRLCSCIRGLFNTGVPYLRHVRRWKRRGDWPCPECVGLHALAVDRLLNYSSGVGDGIGRVWGLKNVQGTVHPYSVRTWNNLFMQPRRWWNSLLVFVACV